MAQLEIVSLRGFRSIEKLEEFQLKSLNVLIGANGSGKSTFVDFFRVVRAIVDLKLQSYIAKNGPADGYFFDGVSHTKRIEADLWFGQYRYFFRLEPTAESTLVIADERAEHTPTGRAVNFAGSHRESNLEKLLDKDESNPLKLWHDAIDRVMKAIKSWQVYHFHDTSMTAGMRRDSGINQSSTFHSDGSNLAAFLLNLRGAHRERYDLIRKALQRIVPYFDDFDLRVIATKPEDAVRLTWRRVGSDYIFAPGHMSDGTIRFLCLTTALLQPNPPEMVVLDEPELGLHPEAISVLAGLVRSASANLQIILTTQSPMLLSEFEPGDIITVDQIDGATRLNRLDEQALETWLADFSLGELWQKGTIRGGVNRA